MDQTGKPGILRRTRTMNGQFDSLFGLTPYSVTGSLMVPLRFKCAPTLAPEPVGVRSTDPSRRSTDTWVSCVPKKGTRLTSSPRLLHLRQRFGSCGIFVFPNENNNIPETPYVTLFRTGGIS